ncbi:MAG: GntR family transcriptional regulator [Pseudomonadota bacterium]
MNVMQSSPGKETSATRECYQTLRKMILTGALPPGKKLKIEELRNLLQSGASPVREALSLLTSDMLVERLDQRGFRAAPVSKANFEEILMLRCDLEDKALRASLARVDADWEDRLVLSHHHMTRAQRSDPDAFEAAHKTFHMTLIGNANLPMLERYCGQLYDLNIRYRYLAADGPRYGERSIAAEHEGIMTAALAHDAAMASKLLIEHYRRTGEYFIAQMDV